MTSKPVREVGELVNDERSIYLLSTPVHLTYIINNFKNLTKMEDDGLFCKAYGKVVQRKTTHEDIVYHSFIVESIYYRSAETKKWIKTFLSTTNDVEYFELLVEKSR